MVGDLDHVLPGPLQGLLLGLLVVAVGSVGVAQNKTHTVGQSHNESETCILGPQCIMQ